MSIAAVRLHLHVITGVSTFIRDVINFYIMQLKLKFALIVCVRNKGWWKRRGITGCIILSTNVIFQLDSELLQLETCVAIEERKDCVSEEMFIQHTVPTHPIIRTVVAIDSANEVYSNCTMFLVEAFMRNA